MQFLSIATSVPKYLPDSHRTYFWAEAGQAPILGSSHPPTYSCRVGSEPGCARDARRVRVARVQRPDLLREWVGLQTRLRRLSN
jgi:hypothetical protein